MGTKSILAVGILCFFLLNTTSALNCRNGFNTTISGMPLYLWNETYSCSSSSAQSCFLTEVTYTPEFLEEEVTITYGSCVSQSYSSLLTCEEFFGENGASLEQLMNLYPDAIDQIDNVIMLFAEQLAKQINETVSTKNNTELVEMLLDELNITIPENYTELFKAIASFNKSDFAGSLEDVIEAYIAMHPDKFNGSSPFLESLPELLMHLMQNDTDYVMTWRLDLLKEYSTITPATEALSTSIINMLARFGHDNLTQDKITMIQYRPGLYYLYYPNKTEEVDEHFHQMAMVIDMIQPINMSDANSTQWLEDLFPMIVNQTVENLKKKNITVPDEVVEAILNAHESMANFTWTNESMSMFSFEMFLNQTIKGLEEQNITLSNETIIFLSMLPDLFEAIKMNDTSNATVILGEIWMNFEANSCVKNNVTAAYAEAYYNELVGYGVNISDSKKPMLECIPGYFYHRYPQNETAITHIFTQMITYYTNQTEYLENVYEMYNMTLPPELLAFLHLQEEIEAAGGNTTIIMMLLMDFSNMTAQQCLSNNVTQAFAQAFYMDLVNSGVNITESMKPHLECIPSLFYKMFPNNETFITNIFTQMTLYMTNQTQYYENIFAMYNMTIPPELVGLMELSQQILAADQNETVIMMLLYDYANKTFPPTELSKLTVTIMTNKGVNVTDKVELMVRMQSMQFYYQNSDNVTNPADIIFASLNIDLAAGVDIGPAVVNGFGKTTIEIPAEAVFVLENIQPVFDAMMSNSSMKWDEVDQASLALLEAYNVQFPGNTQIELQIASLKLRIALMHNNGTTNKTEVYEYIEDIFELSLELANITKEEFISKVNETFPTMSRFLNFVSELEPGEAAEIGAELYTWFTDPDRNISTLSSIINETIHIILERKGVDFREVLQGLFEPETCKFETCDINGCNVPGLVENVTAVTKPVVTTTPQSTTSPTTVAPTTEATTPTTPATPTTPITTTSGATTVITSGVSSLFFIFNAVYSFRMAL